ncbi:MAG: malto-oligosyltrehalose synthase [Gammaproteobacteria bacterium]
MTMSRLNALAEAIGLATSYIEIDGTRRQVPADSLCALIKGLGYDADENGVEATLAALAQEKQSRLVPPTIASFEPAPPSVVLNPHAIAADAIEWTLEGEGRELNGASATADLEAGSEGLLLSLPALPPGYYQVRISTGKQVFETQLVRAPAKAWLPKTPARGYGISVQLYEQIGHESIGIGDFSDLAGLGTAAGAMGAATLGVNPLHALFLAKPEHVSPYSPSSRLALNPLYLDVRHLPGVSTAMRERLAAPALAACIKALNAQALVDYPAAAGIKFGIASEAWSNFHAKGGDPAFTQFEREAAPGIVAWARFETLTAEFGTDLRDWPQALRDAQSAACEHFAAEHDDTYRFHLWLQWQAEKQLGAAAQRSREAGLSLGLYHDLALGADPSGAEVWSGHDDFAMTLAVGAPPDPLNPRGQNWGFPPFHPQRLLERGLAPFIELVRANMRHAGVLRIDHVLGLNRLFVIPPGAGAAEGAYLSYPLDLMLAVIALESHRAQCMVIGEDLGTVPEGLRERLAERAILSLRLLYFEHSETGQPRAPEDYPGEALAMIGTHDVVPLPGWWCGEDLARTDRLGLWPSPEAQESAHAARPTERAALQESFLRAELPSAETEPPAAAAYRWLARTPCWLVSIQPEDALDIADPVNVPGTLDEEPNWSRRRFPPWPEWLSDPRFIEVMRAVQTERGAPAPSRQPPFAATYRLQLEANFGFREAAEQVPYLARLGISHLYLSPVMSAVPGSTHGYDMTDPARFDAERGGVAGFNALREALAQGGLHMIVDFVPNHMGAHAANPWWMDLLEWGHASVHDASFDVDWSAEDGRLVVPILGAPLETVLAREEIHLAFEPSGRFDASYFSHRFPLDPATSAILVGLAARRTHSSARVELERLARRLYQLGDVPTTERRAIGLRLEAELATLAEEDTIGAALGAAAEWFASDADRMARLLDRQSWRLASWRRGAEDINYRRFFDITGLAALRMERPAVFAALHEGIRELLATGAVGGLRLDHVDGLVTPRRYLDTLHGLVAAHGGGVPLWVEKILAEDETLCPWPVAGTTGYEILNEVTRFFIPITGAEMLRAIWREFVPDARPFDKTLAHAKREAVEQLLAPMLERVLNALAPQAPVELTRLRNALVETVVALPVYRAYPDAPDAARPAQEALIEGAVAAVSDTDARDWLARLLVLPLDDAARLSPPLRDGVARFWQLAAATMAKGLEDTSFYRDFALLALNEVGGDPRVASLSNENFHARMEQRAREWPMALTASATHDTKRGEDARMRLAQLAGHADIWRELVPFLSRAANPVRPKGLHPADEYLVWQTLLAVWPPPSIVVPDAAERESLNARLKAYLTKALREGKSRSSWVEADEAYEQQVYDYAIDLLDPELSDEFQHRFLPFAAAIARSGALTSLAALTLKCMLPGVPDIYQGTELWDLSLVDPDNRRPVDYAARITILNALDSSTDKTSAENSVERLLAEWPNGRIKCFVMSRLLALRRSLPATFAAGGYRPLAVTGDRRDDVLAFARGTGEEQVIVVVARVHPALEVNQACALDAAAWGDTRIAIEASYAWRECFTGRQYTAGDLAASTLLAPLPAAVLTRL